MGGLTRGKGGQLWEHSNFKLALQMRLKEFVRRYEDLAKLHDIRELRFGNFWEVGVLGSL